MGEWAQASFSHAGCDGGSCPTPQIPDKGSGWGAPGTWRVICGSERSGNAVRSTEQSHVWCDY